MNSLWSLYKSIHHRERPLLCFAAFTIHVHSVLPGASSAQRWWSLPQQTWDEVLFLKSFVGLQIPETNSHWLKLWEVLPAIINRNLELDIVEWRHWAHFSVFVLALPPPWIGIAFSPHAGLFHGHTIATDSNLGGALGLHPSLCKHLSAILSCIPLV